MGRDSVTLSMGTDDVLRLKNGASMFVLLEVSMPTQDENPSVYYVSPEGDFLPAGVEGEWRGLAIQEGGSVLSRRLNTPEDGVTTYTIGLLLTSMSDYAIRSISLGSPEGPSGYGGDDYGFCFVETLNTANMVLMHAAILFSVVALAFIYFKRNKR